MKRKRYFDENWGDMISEMVTIPTALEMYGYATKRTRRIPCMLHGGKADNFGYTDCVFHCFVCDERGNVIQLVAKLFGRKEYDFNGRQGFFTECRNFVTTDVIREDKFKIPADRLLQDGQSSEVVSRPPEGFEEIDDDEIPF